MTPVLFVVFCVLTLVLCVGYTMLYQIEKHRKIVEGALALSTIAMCVFALLDVMGL